MPPDALPAPQTRPGITTHLPAFAFRSAATTLQILRIVIRPVRSARGRTSTVGSRRARAARRLTNSPRQRRANAATSLGFTARRCSALNPVVVVTALDHVQPIHLLCCRRASASAHNPAPACGSPGTCTPPRKSASSDDNHIRLIQPVLRIHELAKRLLRRRVMVVPIHRVVLHKFRLRIILLRLLPLRRQRRRRHRRAQEIQSLPARRLLVRQHQRNAARNAGHVRVSPRYRMCCDRSGSYKSSSVACVRSDPTRPLHNGCSGFPSTLIGRYESLLTSTGTAPDRERKRRREINRLAQNQIFWRLHIRHNRLIRLLGAPASPASAIDAPITFKKPAAKPDRSTPKPAKEIPSPPARANSGVSASSSIDRQYRLPLLMRQLLPHLRQRSGFFASICTRLAWAPTPAASTVDGSSER